MISILPLVVKISLTIFILLLILLFIVKKRKFILFLMFIDIGIGIWQGQKEYNRTYKDFSDVKADIKIATNDLIKEFETNDSAANNKYLDKTLETWGNLKDITKDDAGYYTLILGDTTSMSSVRCSMDSTHQKDAATVPLGSSVTVRGACTGFNKDEMGIGSDVILNRCVIIKNKN